MAGADHARPHPDGRRRHLVDAERLQGGAGADDVDDGVDAADLVEVDRGGRPAVEAALGLGQEEEHPLGPFPDPVGEAGLLDDPGDVAVGAGDAVGLGLHVGLGGGQPAPHDELGLQTPAGDRQPLEDGGHLVEGGAGVEAGAEGHVAGDAGEAVEPGDGRHRSAPTSRRSCATTGVAEERRFMGGPRSGPVPGRRGCGRRRRRRRSRCRCPSPPRRGRSWPAWPGGR